MNRNDVRLTQGPTSRLLLSIPQTSSRCGPRCHGRESHPSTARGVHLTFETRTASPKGQSSGSRRRIQPSKTVLIPSLFTLTESDCFHRFREFFAYILKFLVSGVDWSWFESERGRSPTLTAGSIPGALLTFSVALTGKCVPPEVRVSSANSINQCSQHA